MSKRTGLGRGLGAFFGNDYEDAEAGKSSAKPSDEAGKKTSVRETEQEIEKKSLESWIWCFRDLKNRKNRRLPERQLRKQWEKEAAWELQRHPERRRQKEKPAQPGRRRQNRRHRRQKAEPVRKDAVEVEKEKFLNISEIEPNVSQPRKMFDEEQLGELAESIRRYGVLQPLLVQKKGDRYELIAGERRWRSCQTGRISGSSGDRARVYETADDGDRPDRECTACRFKSD